MCFFVSLLLVDLGLSNDLPLSDLLLLDVSTFLLDDCYLSVLLTVSILFFAMGGVMASFATLGFFPMSVLPSLTIVPVVVTNSWCYT